MKHILWIFYAVMFYIGISGTQWLLDKGMIEAATIVFIGTLLFLFLMPALLTQQDKVAQHLYDDLEAEIQNPEISENEQGFQRLMAEFQSSQTQYTLALAAPGDNKARILQTSPNFTEAAFKARAALDEVFGTEEDADEDDEGEKPPRMLH